MENNHLLPGLSPIKNAVDALRKEIVDLVFERDQLKFTVCENIKASYIREYGDLEYRIYQAYTVFMRLRRKKDFIQARINRQEEINLVEIETLLDQEFQHYQESLQEKLEEMAKAVERVNGTPLTGEESKELKQLYKLLVKKLHPDLQPDQSEQDAEFFKSVVSAFKACDLKTLRLIDLLLQEGSSDSETGLSTVKDSLEQEQKKLEVIRKNIQNEIEELKSVPPYTLKEYLATDEIIRKRKDSLQKQLVAYQEAIKTQNEALKQLLGNKHE